jgi:hypothetical protein
MTPAFRMLDRQANRNYKLVVIRLSDISIHNFRSMYQIIMSQILSVLMFVMFNTRKICNYIHDLFLYQITEIYALVINIPVSYSGGPSFKSRPGNPLF